MTPMDIYWWRGLKPMLKELDPIESLKFKHDVTGLLLTFVERAKTKKAATRSIDDRFTNSPSPNCVQSLATSTPREEYSASTRSIDDRFTNSLSPNLQSLATRTTRKVYSAAYVQPRARPGTSSSTSSSNSFGDYCQYQ
ncbi:hypothetical protein PoB_002198600 [Plakobranchus ocellatus]|uniref:Uncharacterized protein n=1 Tax=Plakobranchus ocellatus TaxID=259542 RepID=A0AAV3Z850_9GAST|nr:hypothetical protein PoB_002198600 [Plakobranchus ocellatus]